MPRLSDKAIEKMAAPDQGQLEVWDNVVPGFGVRVSHGGRRSFVLMYRVRGDSRKRRLTLGPYPALSLADARELARSALLHAKRGVEPAKELAAGAAGLGKLTYAELVDEFIAKYRDADRRRWWPEVERMLRKETIPFWGNRPAAAITREDVQGVLEAVQKRGSPIAANRLLAALRPMFKWAAETGRIPISPVEGMSNPVSEKGRARDHVIDDADLPQLWRAWDEMGHPFGPMFKLLLLTGQRRGEVAGMRWADLDFDKAVWTLSSEDTKAGRAHEVPLSRQAVDIVQGIRRVEGSPYVFTARGNPDAAVSGFSKALTRAHELSGVDDWSIHDLRRTVTSGMARLGVQLPVLAAVLNHSPGQVMGITAVYNRHGYSHEKREAMQAWANHVVHALQS